MSNEVWPLPSVHIADWTGADVFTFQFLIDRLEDVIFGVKFGGGAQVEGYVRLDGKWLDQLVVSLRDPDTGCQTDEELTLPLHRVDGLYVL